MGIIFDTKSNIIFLKHSPYTDRVFVIQKKKGKQMIYAFRTDQ